MIDLSNPYFILFLTFRDCCITYVMALDAVHYDAVGCVAKWWMCSGPEGISVEVFYGCIQNTGLYYFTMAV